MDKIALKALKGSIKKWYNVTYKGYLDQGALDCPLCFLYWDSEKECIGCPVSVYTGKGHCQDSPYWKYRNWEDDPKRMEQARQELEFLVSLLPEGESVVIDGWEYSNE